MSLLHIYYYFNYTFCVLSPVYWLPETAGTQMKRMNPCYSTKKHMILGHSTYIELWFRNVKIINGEIVELEQRNWETNALSRGSVLTKEDTRCWRNFATRQVSWQFGKLTTLGGLDKCYLQQLYMHSEAAENCMEEIWRYLMGADQCSKDWSLGHGLWLKKCNG